MHKKILLNKNLSIEQRLRRYVVYLFLRFKAQRGWRQRHNKVFRLYPHLKKRDEKNIERTHQETWKDFRRSTNLSTYRICKNISGVSDPFYVPEEIFKVDVEPTLNIVSAANFQSIKSIYDKWFEKGVFPKSHFHNINGELFDCNLNSISTAEINEIIGQITYPVVLKPNIASSGGKNVYFPAESTQLLSLIKNMKNYVVQEKIRQHSFFNKFNPKGLNTIRVCLYKSVLNNEVHVINMALRMGKGGSLDNETAGGIVSFIKDGCLHGYALDKYGQKFMKHPDTVVNFKTTIPKHNKLISLSKKIARRLFFTRLISLDMCLDNYSNWRAVEINIGGHTSSQTIRFAQYAGQPFFGKFTDEVIEYCKNNHWATSEIA